MGHVAIVCQLHNDDIAIALVDMRNLSSFDYHQHSSDQSFNKRDER